MENIYKVFISILLGSVFFYYVNIPFLILLPFFLVSIVTFIIFKIRDSQKGEFLILLIPFLIIGSIYSLNIRRENIEADKTYIMTGLKSGTKLKILSINGKINQKSIYFKPRVRGISNGKYNLKVKVDYIKKFGNITIGHGKIKKLEASILNILKDKLRNQIKNISTPYSYKFYSFLKAILLGEQDGLEKDILEDFRYTGAAHILVISGLHIGLIIAMAVYFLEKLPIPYNLKYIIALFAITIYVVVLNFSPSVFRAYIMGAVFLISKVVKEEADIKKSVSLAGIITLLLNPTLVLSISFQLSYMALFGIIYIYNILKLKSDNKLLEMLILSISIQIALAPIFVYYFHTLPILVMLTNLIAIPIGIILVGGAFFTLLISFISMRVALMINFIIEIIYKILAFYIKNISKIPALQIEVYKYIPFYVVLIFYSLMCYYIYKMSKEKKSPKKLSFLIKIIIFVLLVAIIDFKNAPLDYKINTNRYLKTDQENRIFILNQSLYENEILKLKKVGIDKIDLLFINPSLKQYNLDKIKDLFKVKRSKVVYENEILKVDNIRLDYSKKEGDILVN